MTDFCWMPDEGCETQQWSKAPTSSDGITTPSCGEVAEGCPADEWCLTCSPEPGVHHCHKTSLGETVYTVAQDYGIDYQALC